MEFVKKYLIEVKNIIDSINLGKIYKIIKLIKAIQKIFCRKLIFHFQLVSIASFKNSF